MSNDVTVMEDVSMGNGDTSANVQALVGFYAPTKLDDMDMCLLQTNAGEPDHGEANSPEGRLLGGAPNARLGTVIAANPETWVTPACPHCFLLHALADPIVPVRHSIQLAHCISTIAGTDHVQLRLVENAGHASAEFDAPELLSDVADFLDKSLNLS